MAEPHAEPHKKMTDEERRKMVEKMDEDLEDFIRQKMAEQKDKPEQKEPAAETDIDALAEELLQHPMFIKEIDYSKPLPPLIEGLQVLKYECDDAEDRADSYKEDGNHNFKFKKYRFAISSYTEGIKSQCENRELNAILYCNRAAAHYHLGNFRSSFCDCIMARKFKPDHMKAVVRGAQCCIQTKKYDDAIRWCDNGLLLDPNHDQLLPLRSQADKLKRTQEKDRRKELAKERKEREAELNLIKSINERGIKLAGVEQDGDGERKDSSVLTSLETHHPSGAKVYVDDEGVLHWPVYFLYPEYTQSDFIGAFNENQRFIDHIEFMFGAAADPAPWDEDKKYIPNKLEVYFEDKETQTLHLVKKDTTLVDILRHGSFKVYSGTPSFIILVSGSVFKIQFMKKYKSKSVS